MSSKVSRTGHGFAFAMAAGLAAVFAIVASKQGFAQMEPTGNTANTMSIQRGSEKANELKEPSYQTREERLQAKPLDWNSTIGTPKPLVPSSDQPEASASGAPNPNADEEALKLHPNEWK
jgi:hypothetical protein